MNAIFLKIVNMSITAGWLVLAVILLRLLLTKAPKWMRGILWGFVALRLSFPFSIESVFSLIPSSETLPNDILTTQTPAINGGNLMINDSLSPNVGGGINPIQVITSVATVIWLVGIAAMLIYALVSYIRLKRRVSESVCVKENIWMCDRVSTPFILGIIKPRIYLPSAMNEEDTRYVIAHEKAHLKRYDHIWKPLGFLFLSVYWFNPVLWVAYVLFCRDIELACDEKVVKELGNEMKKPYSEALINCSVPRKMITACPLAFGEVGVKERVKSVLNYKRPSFWIVLVALIASLAVAVGFLTNPKTSEKGPNVITGGTFEPVKLIYTDGMYSFVQTAENAPYYRIVNDMVLQEIADDGSIISSGNLERIQLNEENFDSRFQERWFEGYTLKELKSNNKQAWQQTVSEGENNLLYLLLEQNDGTMYLGYGYYGFESENPSNSDDSHIRWLYKLEKVSLDDLGEELIYEFNSDKNYALLSLSTADKKCTISLSVYSSDSSCFPMGTYEETDEYLVIKTDDGEGTYTFRKEGNNLVFVAGKSSAVPSYVYLAGEKAETCIPDGAVFSLSGSK